MINSSKLANAVSQSEKFPRKLNIQNSALITPNGLHVKKSSLSPFFPTEPSIMTDIVPIKLDEVSVLLIRVDEFPIKPVSFKGKYFKRVSNSNHQMNAMEISNMHLQSLQLSWDAYEANDTIFDELDTEKIDKFLAKVNQSGRFRLTGDKIQNLQKLNLLKGTNPTNAAKLLFGKEQTWHNIHIGRFKTPSMILDDKMLKLSLFEAVEETM